MSECCYPGPGGTGPAPHPKGPKGTRYVLYEVVITQNSRSYFVPFKLLSVCPFTFIDSVNLKSWSPSPLSAPRRSIFLFVVSNVRTFCGSNLDVSEWREAHSSSSKLVLWSDSFWVQTLLYWLDHMFWCMNVIIIFSFFHTVLAARMKCWHVHFCTLSQATWRV